MKDVFVQMRRKAGLALVFMTLMVGAVFALPYSSGVLIRVGQDQKVVVAIQQVQDRMEVSLVNAAGQVIFREMVRSDRYAKAFNLQDLEEGDYTVIVAARDREVRQPFTLLGQTVSMDERRRMELLLPQIRLQENAVDLNLSNPQVGQVRVSIIDRGGDLVFEDAIGPVVHVQRRYNLSKLPSGDYTFVVRTPERVLYQDFKR